MSGATPPQTENEAHDASAHAAWLEAGRLLFAQEVQFVKGVVAMSALPDGDRPEIAFAGRSNVGKSSLINALLNRKNLARASAAPGRTRELNYFDLAGQLYVVDLPGFGFAKAPKTEIARWTKLTKSFLRGRVSLRRVFLLVDSRRGIGEPDVEVMQLLSESAVVFQIVLTKMDKLKSGEIDALMDETRAKLKKQPAAHPVILATSSEKGDGIAELRAEIAELIGYGRGQD